MVKLPGAVNEQLGVRAVWSLQVEVQPDLPWFVHNGSVGHLTGMYVDLTRVSKPIRTAEVESAGY